MSEKDEKPARGANPDGSIAVTKVVTVKCWGCVPCNESVPHGEPCPQCGKQLLED